MTVSHARSAHAVAGVVVLLASLVVSGCDGDHAAPADPSDKAAPPSLSEVGKSDSTETVVDHERPEFGSVVEGVFAGGAWVHAWPVSVTGPATLKLETVVDPGVDTVLAVQAWDGDASAWGDVVAENDDSPDDISGASLLWVDVDAGRYQITVRAFDELSGAGGFSLYVGCEGVGCSVPIELPPIEAADTPPVASLEGHPATGLSDDFVSFLDATGYDSTALARRDIEGGSFGGRVDADQSFSRQPVIFIHGNADRAIGGPLGGWSNSIEAFLADGYSSAELYATTWGPATASQAALQYHSRGHLTHVRAFVESVLTYTGADKVDIISHSMGVTLARKAIAGGAASDALAGGSYDLGPPLTDRVDTFVGIAGANLGLTACWLTGPTTPTCGATNGFYPGQATFWGTVVGRSVFLDELNATVGAEGDYVYSIWSTDDELVGHGGIVWGAETSAIAGQDGALVLTGGETHLETKATTAEAQLKMVVE